MIMKYDLLDHTKEFSEYTELRVQENRSTRIVLIKGDTTANERNTNSGVSARVYSKGSWGFASNPEIESNTISAVIQSATDNALFLASREKKEAKKLPEDSFHTENEFFTNKPKKTQKDMVDFLKVLDAYLVQNYPSLTSRTIVLNCLDTEKTLLTSTGSSAYSMIPRTILYVILSTEKNGIPVELAGDYGGLGQFEDTFHRPDDLFDKLDKQCEYLMHKKEGIFADAGIRECVLDAELAGILAHEAIGHTTEADIVLGGSVAGDCLNQQVANPLITLVDFAHTSLGKTCPVPVYCDDEGTKARDAILIQDGVLTDYMLNKETAVHFTMNPTGNARAYRFSDEPIIRMRNTAIVPGIHKLDDMIASIDDGYYLIRPSNGQADSTSEFMFGITLAYEIKQGKIGRALKDTTISGVAFDVLKTVTMVSDDIAWSNAGMCGKKQLIPVGLGGPAIKCKVNIGGK
jgi:TldD protein